MLRAAPETVGVLPCRGPGVWTWSGQKEIQVATLDSRTAGGLDCWLQRPQGHKERRTAGSADCRRPMPPKPKFPKLKTAGAKSSCIFLSCGGKA